MLNLRFCKGHIGKHLFLCIKISCNNPIFVIKLDDFNPSKDNDTDVISEAASAVFNIKT